MTEEKVTTEEKNTENVSNDTPTTDAKKGSDKPQRRNDRSRRARGGRRNKDRGDERQRSEFDQKIISLRRVSRVVAGGRRFSFSAAIVAGDRKGRVGVGVGKGIDTALAMDKAFRDAKKNMKRLTLTETKSIPHDVDAKYAASVVALKPSPARGIVAGSSVRTVLELAGITDVTAKLQSRSKNKINNARATVEALNDLRN